MTDAREIITESIRTGIEIGWNPHTIALRLENDIQAGGLNDDAIRVTRKGLVMELTKLGNNML